MFLYLLTLNFQEFFDAKPLFEDLDGKLKGEGRRKIVIFPDEFMSLRDRPYFDEILARVREEKEGIFLHGK